MNLALFFTRGVSLRTWRETGMFTRETALYRRLVAAGVKVAFVTYGDRRDLDEESGLGGIRVLCNRWALAPERYERWLPWLHAFPLRRADVFKSNQFDGADAMLWTARRWRKPAVVRGGYLWSEFVANQHGRGSPQAAWAQLSEGTALRAADRVVVTTPVMRSAVVTRNGVEPERITVIPNYVDTEALKPAVRRPGSARRACFVGRLHEQKNIPALLEALVGLNLELTLVGSGELAGSLQALATRLGANVRFAGNLPHEQVAALMQGSDLFVMPSLYEGHPKALLEAMASGLPIVATDTPGIRELVRHGETGWLCGTDTASIRAAIQHVAADPTLRARLGAAAREYAVAHFSLARIVDLELTVLRETVADARRSRKREAPGGGS
jgi:glycosyltransferase involved in cell wall biosynthesis